MQEIPYGTDVVQEPDKLAAAAIADDIHDATVEQLHDQLVSVMIPLTEQVGVTCTCRMSR